MNTYKLLSEMPRGEAIRETLAILDKIRRQQNPTLPERDLLNQLVRGVEALFIREIRERQAQIPGLDTGDLGYTAVWGGELTPGCQNCVDRGFNAIRSSSTCNLRCEFCYYGKDHDKVGRLVPGHLGVGHQVVRPRDVKLMVKKMQSGPHPMQALAWVFFEPFSEFDKHPELIAYVHAQGIHQHLYTNGTLCTRDNLKVLADAGLDEIRFNLAASKCADNVLEVMRVARDLFPYVCIESPMFPEYFERFVAKREAILATGVDHIHCAELHLNDLNQGPYADDDTLYRYGDGYLSPMWSRRLTYDLMDLAVAEGWQGVAIHDCSNEVKFLRGVSIEEFGEVDFDKERPGIPLEWFHGAVHRYDFTPLAEG